MQIKKTEEALFAELDIRPNTERERLEDERDVIMGKVGLLAQLHPNTFRRKYKFRFWKTSKVYPLAALCALEAPQALIELAYDLCPAAVCDAFRVQCFYGKDIRLLCWLYSKSPTVVKQEEPVTKKIPLHEACESKYLDVVNFVHDLYPEGLTHKTRRNFTPLFLAFKWSSLPVIKYLLAHTEDKSMALHETESGSIPLHAAFLNSRKEVADFVIASYPQFLQLARPYDGRLPLHYACAKASSTLGITVLLENYPDAAKVKDKKGQLPLALACKNKTLKEDHDLLGLILRYNPDAMDAVDTNGDPAVDLATSRKLVKHLVNGMGDPPAKRQRG